MQRTGQSPDFTPDKCSFMTIDCIFVELHEKAQKSTNEEGGTFSQGGVGGGGAHMIRVGSQCPVSSWLGTLDFFKQL